MKKYLLTALLGAFCLFGFASADTVDNFTSDSSVCKNSLSTLFDSYTYFDYIDCEGLVDTDQPMYACISTSDLPYTTNLAWGDWIEISNGIYCLSSATFNPNYVYAHQWNWNNNISGYLYVSNSAITYSNSTQWSWGGSSSNSSWILNASWQAYLWNVLTSIQSVVSEFIPYMVYLALWVLVVTLGFVAVKWLLNYVSRKTTSIFKSKRR